MNTINELFSGLPSISGLQFPSQENNLTEISKTSSSNVLHDAGLIPVSDLSQQEINEASKFLHKTSIAVSQLREPIDFSNLLEMNKVGPSLLSAMVNETGFNNSYCLPDGTGQTTESDSEIAQNPLVDENTQLRLANEFEAGKKISLQKVPFKGNTFYTSSKNTLTVYEGPMSINEKTETGQMQVLSMKNYVKDQNGHITRTRYQFMPTESRSFLMNFAQKGENSFFTGSNFNFTSVLNDPNYTRIIEVQK
ncbi:MAG: hypothetical protein AB2L14_28205 [Candidatus Xenobiia bacterium LiM19]